MRAAIIALVVVGTIGLSSAATLADPVVPEGYTVDNYATGIGSAAALALGPDGQLYITDYGRGQLLRRTPAGALVVVASGLPYSNALAILPSGRIFVGANDSYVYEIVGGVPQVFAGGFSYIASMAQKGDHLYVANSGSNSISKVSTVSGAVTVELTGVVNPFGVSFDALGNMYFISHAAGEIYTYNFTDPPRRLVTIPPYAGTYTGFGFDGRLFWGDYGAATLYTLRADGTPSVFATGFAGGAAPPAIGPNAIVAQGADVIFVADGHDVWRISRRPEAAGVMQDRSIQVSQLKSGGWMVRCNVQYTGVNGAHEHRVTLDVVGPGISAGPVAVAVGPSNRSFVLQDAGTQTVKVVLSPSQLWLERAVYMSSAPARGDVYWCEGSGQDTTSGGYLRTTHMEDVSH